MRLPIGFALLAFWLALAAPAAERVANWRIYPVGELPTLSVTLSPRGRIIAKHADGAAVTILDGYTTRDLTLPEGAGPRIYESRSGQFWTLSSEGLLLFQRGNWTPFSIPELRLEMGRAHRQTRPVSLVPAEVNRVLALLSDRLIEFDASTRRVSTLKNVSDTGLGQFSEMVELAEGGLIVSGAKGLARVQENLRRLNAATPWQEYLLATNSMVEGLQRPFEMRDGKLLSVGFDRVRADLRHILAVGPDGWHDQEIAGEKFRYVWPGWGDTRWALAFNALYRFTPQGPNPVARESGADTYHDVVAATNGVFWVATSAGVIRYAPPLWRTPPELTAARDAESPAPALAAGENSVWLATVDGLVRVNDTAAERFPWPDELIIEQLTETPRGKIVVGSTQRILIFDPLTRRFVWMPQEPGATARALGTFRDGSTALRIANTNGVVRLERFDGERRETIVTNLTDAGLNGDVTFAIDSRAGDLWLGGAFGLARLRAGGPKAEIFGATSGLPTERLVCVAEVAEDKFWAASIDAIYELRGARWERIKSNIERLRGIFRARDGVIWVAASDGVHQFNNGVWLAHGDDEGLPSLVIHDVIEDRRGRIWAATSRGAVQYFPESDLDEPRTLTPTIVETDADETRGVTIRFQGVDKWNYTPSARLLYAYRLDEGSWSPFTNLAFATFPKLSAGPHYLQARAMDRNGNQDSSTATLDFAVALPWSRDPRLIAVAILALIAVAFFAALAVNRHWRLKRSYAEIERKVAERTAQLEKANQELLHSQKMRALGTLAAGIAHDFNNILSIIKGSAQIIENNPDDKDKVLTRVNRIQTVVDQGAGIVRSMLGLGKVSDQTECDPGELLEETIRLLADRFPPEVQVRYEKNGAAPPRFTCSKGVIHQILQNLILNAVDASGGKGEITLRARLTPEPGSGLALHPAPASAYLAIEVQDRGSGITPEALPRIFEPFYTTKAFSSRRGTGLGLSMVYELAKGLGYGLAIHSTLGKGTSFILLAPLDNERLPI